jgi:hypothetical protein
VLEEVKSFAGFGPTVSERSGLANSTSKIRLFSGRLQSLPGSADTEIPASIHVDPHISSGIKHMLGVSEIREVPRGGSANPVARGREMPTAIAAITINAQNPTTTTRAMDMLT